MTNDHQFLAHAIRLAERGLGRTWPNPSVGCVLVKNGAIIAAARTADGGRPHAETQALAAAGGAAGGATAYVSLEPCSHHGKTSPCAQALIDAGIARVVVGAIDPDPRVSGRGIAMLQAAGIIVEHQPMQGGAAARGFFKRIAHGVPYVQMKLATSLDGYIADAQGNSQWITGPAARAHGHGRRAQADAILTGIGTVLADNPALTVRLPGLTHPDLVRVICDRRLRLPLTSQLVRTANQQPVWLITHPDAIEQAASHAVELREAGVKLCVVEDATLSPATLLRTLGDEGITRLLVEAGPGLSTSFLAADAVDTLYWYRAPKLFGNTGIAAINALHTRLSDATHWTQTDHLRLGPDQCAIYEYQP